MYVHFTNKKISKLILFKKITYLKIRKENLYITYIARVKNIFQKYHNTS